MSPLESAIDAGTWAAQNGATFLVLSDPDELVTGGVYPIFNFPTHIFIDRDGVIRSIILEDMSTKQALSEGRRLLEDHSNELVKRIRRLLAVERNTSAVGRRADATALVAADLASRANGRTTTLTANLIGPTELLGTTPADRGANATTLVATEFTRTAKGRSARISWQYRRAELARATLTKRHTSTAAFVAAVLAGSTDSLVTLLTEAKVFGTRRSHRHAESAALRTTLGPFQAEHGGTRIDVLGNADSGAVSAPCVRVTSVQGIDALVPRRTRDARDATAHSSGLSDLGPCIAAYEQRGQRARHEGAHHPPPRTSLCDKPRPLVKSCVVQGPSLLIWFAFEQNPCSCNAQKRWAGTASISIRPVPEAGSRSTRVRDVSLMAA